jgi:cardiolipin synthase A/B
VNRRALVAALVLLALLELGLLLTAHFGRHKPDPATAKPAVGLPDPALPFALTTPTLYIEPTAGFTWVYTLVNNAKASIDLTMYELVDTTFSADLVAACQRGVKVRVILDQSLEKTANTPAYNQLSAAGPNCTVAWSNPQFQATHEKSIIVDGNTAAVMTFNLTSRYYAETRDMALVDTDTADVGAIEATFTKDFGSTTDKTFEPNAGHNLIWSPTTAEDDLISLINGAKSTLLVENEELGASTIVDALASACKRGVKVSLAMTDTSTNYHASYATLEQAGCGVHIGPNNSETLYIHAKAIVADLGTSNAVGYVGSINFSNASMTENRELGLYVHDANNLTNIANTITSDFNQFPAYAASKAPANTQPALP